ncbi:hypothetical protein JCM19055_2639 [Geomicrobium sp. JCM 19055]|nr:hypothetical protein JCM19055_2639 [Geomicrobium sp. JCM 19055]
MGTGTFLHDVMKRKKTHPQDCRLGGESNRGATPVCRCIATKTSSSTATQMNVAIPYLYNGRSRCIIIRRIRCKAPRLASTCSRCLLLSSQRSLSINPMLTLLFNAFTKISY